jgi:ADP-ribose pyrophosphatase YjhB (NUDIX family)
MCFASVAVEDAGRFVLVRETEVPRPGGWVVPGGTVEPGEAIEAGAIREAREESGLVVELLRPLAAMGFRAISPAQGSMDFFHVTFLGRAVGGELKPEMTEEIDDAAWFSMEEIEEIVASGRFRPDHPFDVDVLRALREHVGSRATRSTGPAGSAGRAPSGPRTP